MSSIRIGALALLVLFSGCSLFESKATRNEKAYERYIGQSRQAKIRRQTIQSPPPKEQVDVGTGDNSVQDSPALQTAPMPTP